MRLCGLFLCIGVGFGCSVEHNYPDPVEFDMYYYLIHPGLNQIEKRPLMRPFLCVGVGFGCSVEHNCSDPAEFDMYCFVYLLVTSDKGQATHGAILIL